MPLADKIRAVATRIYGAKDVSFTPAAMKTLKQLTDEGCGRMPVCIAETPYSFSDDPKKLGAPEDYAHHPQRQGQRGRRGLWSRSPAIL